jgi:hypothetical protein
VSQGALEVDSLSQAAARSRSDPARERAAREKVMEVKTARSGHRSRARIPAPLAGR